MFPKYQKLFNIYGATESGCTVSLEFSKNILWGLAVSGIIVFLDPILMWLAWPKNYWLQYFFACLLDKCRVTRFCTGASGTHDSTISALYVILLLASFVAIYYQSKRIMITDLQGNNDQ